MTLRGSTLRKVGTLGATLGLLAACGGSSGGGSGGGGSSATPGATAVCQGKTSNPGYTNGIAQQPNQATSLSGAGSTFVASMMSVWTSSYAAKGPILQVPLVLAPVVVTYNVQGVSSGLKLDGETVGRIFAGEITTWNDPAIQRQNKAAKLPSIPIAVVHRSDGSGTTDIFTDFLTKESPSWTKALGGSAASRGKTVAWPVGIGGKGNEGVSGAVSQTNGAIGYVELGYALTQHLPYADMKNKSGAYIEPCNQTVLAATNGVTYPADLRFDLTDGSDPHAYPITGTTWALIYQNQTSASKAAALINFFSWVLTSGQDMTSSVNYQPLGKDLQQKCIDQLKKMTLNGQPIVQ